MALTGTNRGSGGNTTTATTLAISPTSNFTPGTWAVLCVGYDNSGASGADPYTSITDNAGNRWSAPRSVLNDPGAALAGSVLRIFTAYIGKLLTSDVITITFNTTTPSKAWTITEIAAPAGFFIDHANPTGNTSSGSTLNPSINTVSSAQIGEIMFACCVNASNAAMTADSDTTNGTWSTAQTGTAGNATSASNIEIISQFKVQITAVSAQTYDTVVTANTWCNGWINLRQTAIPNSAFTFSQARMVR